MTAGPSKRPLNAPSLPGSAKESSDPFSDTCAWRPAMSATRPLFVRSTISWPRTSGPNHFFAPHKPLRSSSDGVLGGASCPWDWPATDAADKTTIAAKHHERIIARHPVLQVSGEVLPRRSLMSWMKLVDVPAVAPGADAERSAEFRRHMRLIAITELGGEGGEGLAAVPQGKAEPGQAAQALERAQGHPGSGAKGLGDIDRMVVRNAGHLAQAPAAMRLIADGFNHSGDPSAAVRPAYLRRIKIADDFGRQRGQSKLFVPVRCELEGQLFRRDPDRCRT